VQFRLSNVHLTSRSAVVAAVGLVGRGQSMRDAASSVRTAKLGHPAVPLIAQHKLGVN